MVCILQVQPDQVCKQLGLCFFNGAQYVRSVYSYGYMMLLFFTMPAAYRCLRLRRLFNLKKAVSWKVVAMVVKVGILVISLTFRGRSNLFEG